MNPFSWRDWKRAVRVPQDPARYSADSPYRRVLTNPHHPIHLPAPRIEKLLASPRYGASHEAPRQRQHLLSPRLGYDFD